MNIAYAIHADANSELSFDDVGKSGMHLMTSQCRLNDMRCEDTRNKAALAAFFNHAEVSPAYSGIFMPFHNENFDYFFNHYCSTSLHFVLLANKALMHKQNQAIESNLLKLRSDKGLILRTRGIKPASIKVLLHRSGTAFAGLAATQFATALFLKKMTGQKISKQVVKSKLDSFCKNALNLSLINIGELSKSGRKLLNLNIMQVKGFAVINIQNDEIVVLDVFNNEDDGLSFCMNLIVQSKFLMPVLHISKHKNTENHQHWQSFNVALNRKKIVIKQSLPSLVAMLSFGKSVINFGWIESEKDR